VKKVSGSAAPLSASRP